ncbi:MAG TPA: biopolymer transporter ExbD [Aquabacterium sp.]|nr:biopolymer transporter ExbD [Aquabacterium sp.]
MAISFDTDDEDDAVNATINTTPLVDVMLVLLIIFLITIPVVRQTVPLQLPHETNAPREVKPEQIEVSVTAQGELFWDGQHLSGPPELLERLKVASVKQPQPELHIRGDQSARYEHIGRVVLAAKRAAITKISFITEPPAKG